MMRFLLRIIILGIGLFAVVPAAFAFDIVNVHEHAQTLEDAKRLIPIMDELGIKTTVILGSPEQTFYPNRISGTLFENYDQNNEEILKIAAEFPDRFVAFCTGHQEDPQLLLKIQSCVERGAQGIKFFSGHGTFHTIPLNDPSLDSFYSYLEQEGVPILWHVNTGKYLDEFEAVLLEFPNLQVICPHYCMASRSPERLQYLLETYPGLMIDMSFGFGKIAADGFKTVSENRKFYRNLIRQHGGRFFFGTDFVITQVKGRKRITENFRAYRNQAEKPFFFYQKKRYRGLYLPKSTLQKVYLENFSNRIGKLHGEIGG